MLIYYTPYFFNPLRFVNQLIADNFKITMTGISPRNLECEDESRIFSRNLECYDEAGIFSSNLECDGKERIFSWNLEYVDERRGKADYIEFP